jgi:hypothetical protein
MFLYKKNNKIIQLQRGQIINVVIEKHERIKEKKKKTEKKS